MKEEKELFKDHMDAFEPLGEEEQKDLLWMIFDSLDEKDINPACRETLSFIALFLTKNPEFMGEIGFNQKKAMLKAARVERERYAGKGNDA